MNKEEIGGLSEPEETILRFLADNPGGYTLPELADIAVYSGISD
jgi:hypothetical protein